MSSQLLLIHFKDIDDSQNERYEIIPNLIKQLPIELTIIVYQYLFTNYAPRTIYQSRYDMVEFRRIDYPPYYVFNKKKLTMLKNLEKIYKKSNELIDLYKNDTMGLNRYTIHLQLKNQKKLFGCLIADITNLLTSYKNEVFQHRNYIKPYMINPYFPLRESFINDTYGDLIKYFWDIH